jgi:hypothetical protein
MMSIQKVIFTNQAKVEQIKHDEDTFVYSGKGSLILY